MPEGVAVGEPAAGAPEPARARGGRFSLRRRVAWWLLPPLVILMAINAFLSYRAALVAVNQAYDCSLSASIRAIAERTHSLEGEIEVDIPYAGFEVFEENAQERIFHAIVHPSGDTVTGEVDNGTLRISNSNTCNFVRSFKKKITVRIYAPEFTDIQYNGTGDVTSVNTLKGSFFKIENRNSAGTIRLNVDLDSIAIATHTGVTDAIITGSSGRTFLFNQGVGLIDSRHLNSASVFVNNSSINDVFVNTIGYMYAYIKFSGNIYYHGQPTTIDKEIMGSGKVVEIE